MDFPDHPFWDFSLALYARPGVAEACLRLQDGPGLDVNLLLFACWSAAERGAPPSRAGWRRLIDGTAAWRSQVVVPLRGVRRFLKNSTVTPWSAALRERVKALELDAEHAEQLAIADLAEPGDRRGDPLAALLDYVDAVGVTLSEADRSDLAAIAAQVAENAAKL